MRSGNRYRRLYSGSGLAWASQYIALDGTRPAIIADFNRGLYAVPAGLTSSTAGSASIDQLTRLRAATFDEVFAFVATSTTARSYLDQDGTRRNDLAANVPRFAFDNGKRQLQLENQSTNLVRNGDGAGAVAGTPGTTPTHWFTSLGTGVSRQVVGSGVLNGIPYVDIRFFGTPTSSPTGITFDISRQAAANGESHTASCYLAIVGGSTSGFSFVGLRQITWSSAPASISTYIGTDLRASLNSTYTRYQYTATLTDAATATVETVLAFSGTGSAVDITIRIGALQHERSQSFGSAYIPTTTATVTRAIETCQVSALTQALVSRAACTIAVRGRLSNTSTLARALFGNDGTGTLLYATNSSQTLVTSWNGSTGVNATLGAGAFNTSAFGAALAYDAGGRAVSGNGGAVASDANATGARAVTYLGRSPGSSTYGDGFYDAMVIYPARVTLAALQALAVAT